ncbi:MAG: LLM class F420-dependent oxidoreductase [Actinomycetota bacterium]|nr:LLM class F420-dependent oxidoreductase [Actinomycetota bacterium]
MSKPTVNIGRVGIWYGGIDALPTPEARRAAQLLEELGYGALWVAEAVGRDPFVSSAVLLAATERIALATGIANIYARDPMTMAAAQRTLAEAFPGRFLLGLGVSHAHLVSNVRKHDYSKPYSYMVEYLQRMDESLFMAIKADDDGGRVLAALGPKMLQLSASAANGAHPYFTTPEHTAIARATMGADALLAPEQMVVLNTDPTEARRIARAGMAVYLRAPNYTNNLKRIGFADSDLADGGSDRLVDAIVAWGDEQQIADRVAQHHAAGADHVCVQVLQDGLDGLAMPETQWRRLAPALLG